MTKRLLTRAELEALANKLCENDPDNESEEQSDDEDGDPIFNIDPNDYSSESSASSSEEPCSTANDAKRDKNKNIATSSVNKDNRLSNLGNRIIDEDGTVWEMIQSEHVPAINSNSAINILEENRGPTSAAKRSISSEILSSAWRLLINESMLLHVKECTEAEAHRQLDDTSWTVTSAELDAFIALLYARGALGARNQSIDILWSNNWGPRIFSETMPRIRFKEIMRFIRFDSNERNSTTNDNFALISEVWDKFIENCVSYYVPGDSIAIGEQLFPTKTKCPFSRYVSNKPDKFGIKFWMAADADSKYILNAFPYLGEDDTSASSGRMPDNVALRLMAPYKTNKKFPDTSVNTVDVVDQMAKLYSTKSPSRRWPLQVFFNVLDLAAINAWILYKEATGKNISRQDYILNLSEELRAGHVGKSKAAKRKLLPPLFSGDDSDANETKKRRKCQVMRCKGNKTNVCCNNCNLFVCGKCTSKTVKYNICANCSINYV